MYSSVENFAFYYQRVNQLIICYENNAGILQEGIRELRRKIIHTTALDSVSVDFYRITQGYIPEGSNVHFILVRNSQIHDVQVGSYQYSQMQLISQNN